MTQVGLSEKLQKELEWLDAEGVAILNAEMCRCQPALAKKHGIDCSKQSGPIAERYQVWYSAAAGFIKTSAHDRYDEFVSLYSPDARRKSFNSMTMSIAEYLMGYRPFEIEDPYPTFHAKFQAQHFIFRAAVSVSKSVAANIESRIEYEVLDRELDVAEQFIKLKLFRAAGAVSGVVLERHLAKVCSSKGIKLSKRDPALSDLNDAIKAANVIDVAMWRFIQRLADIRNKCVHAKADEPRKDELDDLLLGVRKVTAEVN